MAIDPILVEVPDEIVTPRLVIRSPRPGTGVEVNDGMLEAMERLRPWFPWAQRPTTPEETEAQVRARAADFLTRRDLHLHLWHRETGAFVGASGLHSIDWSVPFFELDYWCRDRFVGHGFVTEAVRAITAMAFDRLGAQRVEIRCDTRNLRSRSVAERSGFVHEATLRCNERAPDGTVVDTHVFRLIRAEYEAGRA